MSGARSGVIERQQMEDVALKGRDFAGYLKLLPGVIDTRNREAPGWENMNNLSINGRASFNFSYDGVTNKDTGQNGANYAAPALDSIAEIKVQTSNFQAEYGRSSGATITVVTRSGSRDFRGIGGLLQARPGVQRQRVPAPAAMRLGSDGAVRGGALHLRQRGVDAGRSGAHSRHGVQSRAQQTVLLLLAGAARPHRSRRAQSAADADGARTPRRLLTDVRQPGSSASSCATRC